MSASTKIQNVTSSHTIEGDQLSFAQDMKKIINNKELSDIRFIVGPNKKTIYAHKCLLMARCQVFRAMFAEQQAKSTGQKADATDIPLVLTDINADVFLAMLEYIYTNCVTLTSQMAIDVLGTAIEYGLDELKKLCVSYIGHHMGPENVCDAIQAAVTYGETDLQLTALNFIEKYTKDVFKSQYLHELSESALSTMLRSNNLQIDEMEIIRAVKEWANVNSVVMNQAPSKVARNVVTHIRLPLISPDELATVEQENSKDKIIPVDQLSFAWKCHALKQGERGNPTTTLRKGTIPRETHSYIVISR